MVCCFDWSTRWTLAFWRWHQQLSAGHGRETTRDSRNLHGLVPWCLWGGGFPWCFIVVVVVVVVFFATQKKRQGSDSALGRGFF